MALSFIKSSGNIISEEFCVAIASETKADFVKDKSFGPDVKKVDEIIAVTFEKLRERWEENRVLLLENQLDNNALRRKWIIPLFEGLGFSPVYSSSNLKSTSGVDYHISYKGWDNTDAPVIHMVHSTQELDTKDKTSRTHSNKSPHDCLQQFLNTTNHHWALLTNGKKIRLLRDFYHSITKGFLEFDLEGIFETANSEQFRILYRILHRSRFENQFYGEKDTEYDEDGNPIEKEEVCILERFHKKSRETGVKIGNKLRDQVIEAIEKLGNGFAQSLNPEEFQNGKAKNLYDEILNIIYRLLFLMFAEQKGWLPVRNLIYAHTYSIGALREKAELGNYSHDHETDLWEGLKITFKLVSKGYTFPTGETINAFGGQLFADHKIAYIINLPLANNYLLDTIYRLSYFKNENLANRINYANLAIDELGSVYESLLDYEPKIAAENIKVGNREVKRGEFYLDPRGTERKSSGSYYTDSRLVAQLIESALVPVIDNALKDKTSNTEKEKALLSLKVGDIACGSGAFLCAALEKMGEQLSLIRIGDEERPTDEQLRSAKRDVLLNCIYGVDLNPMAVELAKFSLWITASLPDMPLTFLDHKLKCGNSLIGATPELINKGIPEGAFKAVGNDIPEICTELKKKVRKQLEQISRLKEPRAQYGLQFEKRDVDELTRLREALNQHKQINAEEVEKVEEDYNNLVKLERKFMDWLLADVWTASFFVEKTDHNLELYPTNATLESIRGNEHINSLVIEKVIIASKKYHFFHFHLEFPEVFEKGGFDCILGNPPWEKIQAEEEEFFEGFDITISKEKDAIKRKQFIESLKINNLGLYNKWFEYKESIEKLSRFCIESQMYLNSARGNINLYKVFYDRARKIISKTGRIGIILQSGLFTDELSKDFFEEIIYSKELVSVYDFVNKKKLFGIHPQMRFSLITSRKEHNKDAFFIFYLIDPHEIHDSTKGVYLSYDTIKSLNPNTGNCPMINDQRRLDLLMKIYKNSIIIAADDNSIPSYDCKFWGEMFNMTRAEKYPWFDIKNLKDEFLPLYESKYIHQFDHRYATFKDVNDEERLKGNARNVTDYEKINNDLIAFRFFVRKELVIQKCEKYNILNEWLFCLRSITSSTNERTVIASILPKYGIANSINIAIPKEAIHTIYLLGALNSFVLDFVAFTKVGNQNLNIFIIKQLPIPKKELIQFIDKNNLIKDRIIKLTYASDELAFFARDFGFSGKPFIWDERERFRLKCELDAIYAHLYGLEKEDMDYILETFPIVKRKDIEKYGAYRTKETILKLYNEFAWVREEMEKARKENIA